MILQIICNFNPDFLKMKQTLFSILVSLLFISACRRDNPDSATILGSWKLIEVYDKSTATTNTPPSGTNKDVVITFLHGNRFTGHTLVNTLTDGTFTLNGNEITFGLFSMTKVAEDPWGGNFVTILHSCALQSVYPCSTSEITILGNRMKIVSKLRFDITLEKL